MKEVTRTMVFAIVAGASVALAAAAHFMSRPAPLAGYEKVGKPFYGEFENPNDAKSLRVLGYNEDTASVREFNVEFKDGAWRIPSHHYYPADAEDRLANTAASVIGITRGALKSRRASDYERYGVINPMSEAEASLKGRGQRLTLFSADESVLADYIIGNQVEGEEGFYYVRRPDEKETYSVALKIDLSTKFADWIETDLLKLDRGDIREVLVNKYSIDQDRGQLAGQETNKLTRESSFGDWKLEGLDETAEELNDDEIRKMVNNLDNLKIVGVRPKPKGIKADLSVDPEIARNPLLFAALRADMGDKGFLLFQDQKGNPVLISKEGEMQVASIDGIVYDLHFGEIFSGSEEEIEIGAASDQSSDDAKKDENSEEASDDETADDDDESDDDESADDESADDDDESADGDAVDPDESEENGTKRSRYLYVTTKFEADRVGAAPTKPTEPEKPAEEPDSADESATDADADKEADGTESEDAKAEDAKAEDAKAEDDEAEDDEATDDAADKADEADEADEKKEEAESAQVAYEKALEQYKEDLQTYEDDLAAYEKKVADGNKKIEELNRRFGGWYYVISAASFENLRLARKDLVKPIEKPEEPAEEPGEKEEPGAEADSDDPASPSAEPGAEAKTDDPANEPAEKPAEKEEPGAEAKSGDPANPPAAKPDAADSSDATKPDESP